MKRLQLGLDLTAQISGAGYVRITVSRAVILCTYACMGVGASVGLYRVVHVCSVGSGSFSIAALRGV